MTLPDSITSLHPIDAVAIAFLSYHGLMGVVRGFAFQCVRLLTWIAAIALSRRFNGDLSSKLMEFDPSLGEGTARAIGFGAIVLGTLIVGLIVVKLTKRLIESWKLAAADRLLGLVLGLAKAIAIVLIVMVVVTQFAPALGISETLASTRTAQASSKILGIIGAVLPAHLAEDYKSWLATTRSLDDVGAPFELPDGVGPSAPGEDGK